MSYFPNIPKPIGIWIVFLPIWGHQKLPCVLQLLMMLILSAEHTRTGKDWLYKNTNKTFLAGRGGSSLQSQHFGRPRQADYEVRSSRPA